MCATPHNHQTSTHTHTHTHTNTHQANCLCKSRWKEQEVKVEEQGRLDRRMATMQRIMGNHLTVFDHVSISKVFWTSYDRVYVCVSISAAEEGSCSPSASPTPSTVIPRATAQSGSPPLPCAASPCPPTSTPLSKTTS